MNKGKKRGREHGKGKPRRNTGEQHTLRRGRKGEAEW